MLAGPNGVGKSFLLILRGGDKLLNKVRNLRAQTATARQPTRSDTPPTDSTKLLVELQLNLEVHLINGTLHLYVSFFESTKGSCGTLSVTCRTL